MSTISVTLPSDGETADAADYNVPINTIVSAINGSLDSNNIAASGVVPNNLQSGTGTSWGWKSWTPTLTNLTLGNGTLVASYIQIGKTVFAKFSFILGSTSAVGTAPNFSLPVTASTTGVTTNVSLLGVGALFDTSASIFITGLPLYLSATTCLMRYLPAGDTFTEITATAPFTWATGDQFTANITYEAA